MKGLEEMETTRELLENKMEGSLLLGGGRACVRGYPL